MERQLPKNVRQIGNICDEPKIYIEDYVETYLEQLREKAAENPVAVALAGEITTCEDHSIVFVAGAVTMKEIQINGTEIRLPEETRAQMEKDIKTYFPEEQFVGWCLLETGHAMSLNRGAADLHAKLFSEENTIFIWKDAAEHDEMFFAYKYGDLMQLGGHYVYYEKNPAMQNYMISTRRENGLTPSEMVEDLAAKNFRSTVREKMETKERHHNQNSRLLYATCAILILIVMALGISTMNNLERMETVQNSLEVLSQNVHEKEDHPKNTTEKVAEASEEVKAEQEIEASVQGQSDEPETEEPAVSPAADANASYAGNSVSEKDDASLLSENDYYTVRKGDTLASISVKEYGDAGHVEAICKMNGLSNGNLIFIGQKLLLP